MNNSRHFYEPDWPPPPVTTILERMRVLDMSPEDLSFVARLPGVEIYGLLQGTAILTPAIAERLESALGVPSHVWLAREAARN